jgi:hypothetical protein
MQAAKFIDSDAGMAAAALAIARVIRASYPEHRRLLRAQRGEPEWCSITAEEPLHQARTRHAK